MSTINRLGSSDNSITLSYVDTGSFPTASGTGRFAWDRTTKTLYVDDPATSTWLPAVPGGGGGGSGTQIEQITLVAGDITNKYVVLSQAPTIKALTQLNVVNGGLPQQNGVDFEITTDDADKRLSWNLLGLESLLEAGDVLVVYFN